MSIKSDNWIRRMARDHKMIEPFAEQQVRQSNGHKIVSYGTSSYGYDVRCANEFKIFTNINSSIVDPEELRREELRRLRRRCVHHPAELVCAGAHRGVLPRPAQRSDRLPRENQRMHAVFAAIREWRWSMGQNRHSKRWRVGGILGKSFGATVSVKTDGS